jgi:hypothetical protein
MSVRTRVPPHSVKIESHHYKVLEACFPAGYVYRDETVPHVYEGLQRTLSEGHPFNHGRKSKKVTAVLSDIGGSFLSQSVQLLDLSPRLNKKSWGGANCYAFYWDGLVPIYFSDFVAASTQFAAPPSNNDIIAYGIKGFAKADPVKPHGQLAQALYELKAGIPGFHQFRQIHEGVQRFREADSRGKLLRLLHPHSKGHSKRSIVERHARALANGYLTWEFEWLPFYKDVQDFCKNVRDSSKLYDQFSKAGYQNNRRRVNLADEQSTNVTNMSNAYYGSNPMQYQAYATGGTLKRTDHSSRKVWYSASFSYYVPDQTGTLSERIKYYESLFRVAYGLELSPRSVWAIMPWSWLADWCSTTGASASNLTDILLQGLASRYAYVMINEKFSSTYELQDLTLADGTKLNGSQTLFTETKLRAPGYSFGFALQPQDFSERQWAILAALGISKGFKNA